jgi:S1-C subfamily serine protease
MGIVSAVGRTGGPDGNINDFIQTDASINQGNSGGPLVNIRGQVVGINTWIASQNGGSVGLGFAIPINNAKRAVQDFITKGSVNDGWLGVSLIDADDETLKTLGLEGKHGALASQVFLGSPADKAGIQPGDFITQADGKNVRNYTHLTQIVGDIEPGKTVKMTAIRDGKNVNFSVKIETRTDKAAADNKKLWPGLMPIEITDDVRDSLDLDKGTSGLYVAQVLQGTPAATIGMQRGDIITEINGTSVKTLKDFYRVLREKATTQLSFGFIRNGTNIESLKFKK